ncbi:MAG: serine hydroxymethyltransferase [Candidatus Omnitrophica bacterium]|nr:serine hydroxymethyltransferase [Candidatus Omnitrophota bacterium]
MNILRKTDIQVWKAVREELKRQEENIELIASENFTSEAVLEACGSVMTNKYAEGYPGRRYYGGCRNMDTVEALAIARAKKLFGAEHANVQPHAGAQANLAVYFAALEPGDKVLALSLDHGGHLSHGYKLNISGRYFKPVFFGVSRETEQIDYNEVLEIARRERPRMILAGASAYPRRMDYKRFREIADEVGAMLFVDMAHIAGLVAAGLHPSPVPYADFVTTTTHKTLRGPRGGLILCKEKYAREIDRAVFPGTQGGPLMHIIAAKAVCLKEALSPSFKKYQGRIVQNAKALAQELAALGFRIVSGGTDTHLFLVDLRPKSVTGKEAEGVLEEALITVNKNLIPFDPQPPLTASGIRIGTPSVTTRGMGVGEMKRIARAIDKVISHLKEPRAIRGVRTEILKLVREFPLYDGYRKKLLS